MSKSEWKTRTIENCLEILSFSKSRRLESSEYQAAGAYPIIDQGQNIIAGWTDDKNAVLFDPLPVIVNVASTFGSCRRISRIWFSSATFGRCYKRGTIGRTMCDG